MKNGERGLWTIDELSARAAEALAVGYEGVPSSRVRDVPDLRTIRYYTTLGLLDRAAAMRGRTALYGPRHLFQLVAIKHLQARGLSLAAVQERMLGKSDAALRKIAEPPGRKRDLEPPAPRDQSFWRLPANAPPDAAGRAASASTREQADAQAGAAPLSPFAPRKDVSAPLSPFALRKDGQSDAEAATPQPADSAFQTIPLSEKLLLSFQTQRDVNEDDLRSIRAAAASLIEILKLRGLIDKDMDNQASNSGDER
jgi:DNA-binding transcriptional MerR regulator